MVLKVRLTDDYDAELILFGQVLMQASKEMVHDKTDAQVAVSVRTASAYFKKVRRTQIRTGMRKHKER